MKVVNYYVVKLQRKHEVAKGSEVNSNWKGKGQNNNQFTQYPGKLVWKDHNK